MVGLIGRLLERAAKSLFICAQVSLKLLKGLPSERVRMGSGGQVRRRKRQVLVTISSDNDVAHC